MIAPSTTKPTPASDTLDDAQRRTICALVSRGCSVQQAARYAGCALSTVRHERDTNDRFRLKLAQAKVKHELAPLRALQRAIKKDWRALAWYLERTQPETFGRRNHRAFTQKQANALIKDVTSIIGEETATRVKGDAISSRVEAAIRYACHAHNDMNRTAAELGRAMNQHNLKSPRYSPHFGALPEFHAPEPTSTPRSAPPPSPKPPLASSASSNLPPTKTTTPAANPKPSPTTPPTTNKPPGPLRVVNDYEGSHSTLDILLSELERNAEPTPGAPDKPPGNTDSRPNAINNLTSNTRPTVGAAQPQEANRACSVPSPSTGRVREG